MTDDKVILTAAEAESLLADGDDTIHNFINPRDSLLVGCDYERADAIADIRAAKRIELAGEIARSMRHPIAVWDDLGVSFFEADMDKVAAFEATRT